MGATNEQIEGRVLYAAVEPFDEASGIRWKGYAAWLGKPELLRVITLDHMLCAPLVKDFDDDDWQHNVQADFLLDLFHDFEYLKQRTSSFPRRNLLAVIANPKPHEMTQVEAPLFDFAGFDIVDMQMSASAILNCGGYPDIFSIDELSSKTGLLQDYGRACEIRDALRERFPHEHHAQCRVWAIWEWVETKA